MAPLSVSCQGSVQRPHEAPVAPLRAWRANRSAWRWSLATGWRMCRRRWPPRQKQKRLQQPSCSTALAWRRVRRGVLVCYMFCCSIAPPAGRHVTCKGGIDQQQVSRHPGRLSCSTRAHPRHAAMVDFSATVDDDLLARLGMEKGSRRWAAPVLGCPRGSGSVPHRHQSGLHYWPPPSHHHPSTPPALLAG